jgi:hypothetical protein
MEVIEGAPRGEAPVDKIFLAMAAHGVTQRLQIDLPRRVAQFGPDGRRD